MLPAERHSRILDLLRSMRTVSTDDLVQRLDVSPETIRRDLAELERRGELRRVHGGAVEAKAATGEEASFGERLVTRTEAKVVIGRLAAGLVSPGQTVIIDVGTTALEVARALPADFHGTVATCSLLAATELVGRPGLTVLVSGGRLRGGDLALSNAHAVGFFADLHADVAFLGSGGLDAAHGLTDYHLDEVATRRTILANSQRAFVLADAAKHGRVAPHRVCGLDALAGLITDGPPDDELARALERAGAAVHAGSVGS
ncbi:DeoR/GlpR family DNA-binding transcription regulator [Pseudonocardia acaciae]|uniref:DeoR/GlpR family DNA-binding transcription regulator n=1 Tax=Pseudonocardia acaciae TaxID=551276 RepID=UPI00048C67DF|nr:DeoR/GlpR family DNA-binding transcription regulator [Pseudonocardia acaciae]